MSASLNSAPPTEAVARLDGLTRSFNGRQVLKQVDLTIEPGEIVALIGRSGSGKSTILRILAGLDRGYTGGLTVTDDVAVAFQDARLLNWKRVRENVSLGLRDNPSPGATAATALGEVGLGHHLDSWPLTLSGGEAQRVSLARALVREPRLLLLDEPFGALDALTRITMHQLVLDLWSRHRPAVLLVTHDVDEALALADRVLVLGDGEIAHQERIELERPREREHQTLVGKRQRLLTELGVNQGATATA